MDTFRAETKIVWKKWEALNKAMISWNISGKCSWLFSMSSFSKCFWYCFPSLTWALQGTPHTHFLLLMDKSGDSWCEWVLWLESRLKPLLETQSHSAESSLYIKQNKKSPGEINTDKTTSKGNYHWIGSIFLRANAPSSSTASPQAAGHHSHVSQEKYTEHHHPFGFSYQSFLQGLISFSFMYLIS